MINPKPSQILFGGDMGWRAEDWTASDDRVRGGSSQSFLECGSQTATFHGVLDIQTLGGAGFASQRTTGEDRDWDLASFDGIELTIDATQSDEKKYTFILKDEILPPNPDNGREQSTTSWEYDFKVQSSGGSSQRPAQGVSIFIPWSKFEATYRGKKQEDAPPIDLHQIKRLSIMMRSFFGTQEGGFRLTVECISARNSSSLLASARETPPIRQLVDETRPAPEASTGLREDSEKNATDNAVSLWDWLLGRCWKL